MRRRFRTVVSVAIAGLGIAALLSGCAASDAPRLIVAKASEQSIAPVGITVQKLTTNDKHCVVMGKTPIIVPPGARLDGDTIHIPGHADLRLGTTPPDDDATLVHDSTYLKGRVSSAIDDCRADNYIWFHPTG